MSKRTEQMSSIIHRAVQSVIAEGLSDPRLEGLITVTGARVTEDLTECIISVSVLPEKNESKAVHALQDASNYIRRQAAERLAIHHPPRLIFKLDRTGKRQAAVLSALAEIERERAQQPPGAVSADAMPGEPDAPIVPPALNSHPQTSPTEHP